MSPLLPVLAAISLLDSTSMLPIATLPLAAILGSRRPLLGAGGFLTGIFLVYIAAGLVLLLGVDALFARLGPSIARWYSAPNTLELLVQIAVGALMVAMAWRIGQGRQRRAAAPAPEAVSPRAAFALGASLMLVGLPGALPYFGAVDQILRADVGVAAAAAALLFYNLVFLLPLVLLVLVRLLLPRHSEKVFTRLADFGARWGPLVVAVLLVGLGLVLVADGIAFLLGHPLLPVGTPPASG